MNFEELDSQMDLYWPEAYKVNAKEYGYSSVSKLIYIEYYTNLKPLRAIGDMLGMRANTVSRCMRLVNWKARSRGQPKAIIDTEALIDLHNSGIKMRGLCKIFGYSHSTIKKALKEHYGH